MGDSPSPPPQQAAPAAPDYAAANREGVMADIETLPLRKQIEAAARMGKDYTDPNTGKTYSFEGLGDQSLGEQQARIDAATADINAQSQLDIGDKYGSRFLQQAKDAIKQADPGRFGINESLAPIIQKEIDNYGKDDPEAMKQVEADVRGRQYAMGNTRGNAPTSDEILGKFDVRNRMKQQTLGNVSQYLAGTPITSQFGSIAQAQNGAAPYQPVNYQPGMGLNPNAGAQGTQFAMQSYGQQSANINAANSYNFNAWNANANRPNPWMQVGGMAIGAAATGAAIF